VRRVNLRERVAPVALREKISSGVLREQALLLPARAAYRRAWALRGIDITESIGRSSCLVVAPHPDDETLGCAVAIMRKREFGTRVTVVIVSDGAQAEPATLPPEELAALRRTEARRAGSRLGLGPDDLHFLDIPDTRVREHVDTVADRLAAALTEHAPEQVLIPTSCEGHPDHDATNVAAREAVRRAGYTGQVLEYGVWLWTHWPWTRGYGTEGYTPRRMLRDPVDRIREVRPLLVSARGYRARQQLALAAHASQVGPGVGGGALPASLLSAVRGPYELYLKVGSLGHLDFNP
jgi:LmbE family N-acetylglucosaminyl deacetylase